MTSFDPTSTETVVEKARQRWQERTDTFARVYYAILGVSEFTHYPEIAERANCSDNSAKKHLERLADMGVACRSPAPKLARYRRNDAYLQWYEANEIAGELAEDEIIERVRQLESRKEEYKKRFDANDPSTVPISSREDHEETHERLEEIGKWTGLQRDIRLYELAYWLATQDNYRLSE